MNPSGAIENSDVAVKSAPYFKSFVPERITRVCDLRQKNVVDELYIYICE